MVVYLQEFVLNKLFINKYIGRLFFYSKIEMSAFSTVNFFTGVTKPPEDICSKFFCLYACFLFLCNPEIKEFCQYIMTYSCFFLFLSFARVSELTLKNTVKWKSYNNNKIVNGIVMFSHYHGKQQQKRCRFLSRQYNYKL